MTNTSSFKIEVISDLTGEWASVGSAFKVGTGERTGGIRYPTRHIAEANAFVLAGHWLSPTARRPLRIVESNDPPNYTDDQFPSPGWPEGFLQDDDDEGTPLLLEDNDNDEQLPIHGEPTC